MNFAEAVLVAAFVIPLDGLTLLTPNVRRRLHYQAVGRLSKEQRGLARMWAVRQTVEHLNPSQGSHVYLTLVRGKGQRMVDLDALGSACKPMLDGIVDARLLVDDSPEWCTPHYDQIKGERARLEVRITQPQERA